MSRLKTLLKLIFRRPLLAVTVVAWLPDQRLVLVQRRDDGTWGLPGGMVDWGETVEATMRRELREETGLVCRGIRGVRGIFSSPERDPRCHSISLVFEVDVEGPLRPGDRREICQVQAFDREHLPEILSHDHQEMLQAIRTSSGFMLR